jgi:uncharacterized DUF497 family protein
MDFQWDEQKERINAQKHGVHFETAAHIFLDRLRMERPDIDSEGEERWQTMGLYGEVLFVVYTERGNKTRIISARPAEPFERRIYYGDCELFGWQRVTG